MIGKSDDRLDILLQNPAPNFGYELTIKASQAKLQKYVDRCETYADMHDAHVFAVNIVRTPERGTPPMLPDLPDSSDKVTSRPVTCQALSQFDAGQYGRDSVRGGLLL